MQKTFNRTYTEGYMFGEDPGSITNIQRPNNFGYEIGTVRGSFKGMYEIALTKTLHQNDIIRIDHENEDVNLSVARLYDQEGKLINQADGTCYIKIKEKLSPGDVVYKTKDYLFYKGLDADLDKNSGGFLWILRYMPILERQCSIDAEGSWDAVFDVKAKKSWKKR